MQDTNAQGDCPVGIYDLEDLKHAADRGYIYVNVHNKEYPNGVIRGQVHSDDYNTGHTTYNKDNQNTTYHHDTNDHNRNYSWNNPHHSEH